MKVKIIICYFGKFPWYFNYFIHSCLFNPSISFLIITDQNKINLTIPQNVTIFYETMAEFMIRARRKLNIPVDFSDAYKVNDFKPAFGLLFDEFLFDYEFWGHGDLDVIYGDIRNFLTSEILEENDVICFRHDYVTGFLTLFRNTDKINSLFMESKDYREVFSSPIPLCFDETNYSYIGFADNLPLNEIVSKYESMTHVVKRLNSENKIKAYFEFHVIEGVFGKLKWENGVFIYNNKFEVLLYHLIVFKKIYNPMKVPSKIPNVFHISPSRIYTKDLSKNRVS